MPPGWNTLAELADTLNISESTLLRRLRVLLKSESAEKKTFRIKMSKFNRDVAHYRLL